jgi:site-specific recombinase XerD
VIPHWEKRCADFVLRRTSLRAIGEAVSVNDLRGTYATHMARAGVPILTLAKIMGNSVAMLEQVYAQVGKRGDHLQQAASKLPRLTQPKPIAREA